MVLSTEIFLIGVLGGLLLTVQAIHWYQARALKQRQARIETLLHEIRDTLKSRD